MFSDKQEQVMLVLATHGELNGRKVHELLPPEYRNCKPQSTVIAAENLVKFGYVKEIRYHAKRKNFVVTPAGILAMRQCGLLPSSAVIPGVPSPSVDDGKTASASPGAEASVGEEQEYSDEDDDDIISEMGTNDLHVGFLELEGV